MSALKAKASQEFVPVKEVRDGVVILKDGGMRGILITSSLNFALKSEENQQAIILQFQNFLNALDFSVQIFIESRRLDIRPYLALLEERYKEQQTDLMKIQAREYIEFIKSFTESVNIMTKTFFVVVPYTAAPLEVGKRGIPTIGFLKKKENGGGAATPTAEEAFEEHKTQLEQRVAVVEQGLLRVGLRSARLGTEEAIELFYKLFNPGETEKPIKVS